MHVTVVVYAGGMVFDTDLHRSECIFYLGLWHPIREHQDSQVGDIPRHLLLLLRPPHPTPEGTSVPAKPVSCRRGVF